MLPAAADGRLVVLDWENSGPLPAQREVGYAVFCFSAGQGAFDRAAAEAFLAAYGTAANTEADLGDGLFSTAIATHLNVLQAMSEQALTETDAGHRSHAEGFIADLLGHDLADLRHMMSELMSEPFAEGMHR